MTAYDIDINRRSTIPREMLLEISPDGPLCSDKDTIRIAKWVACYYNRTALLSLMVSRLGDATFQKTVYDMLETDYEGSPLHESVVAVYGNWQPDDETGPYRF